MANGDYSEAFIQAKLWDYFYQKYKYIFVNMKYFSLDNENDFIGVAENGITIEYEIKTRKFDFVNDFKKEGKHDKLEKAFNSKDKTNSFEVANKFYYAAPPGIINKKDVPKYAGLIEVNEHKVVVVKNAPLLHKVVYNPFQFFDRVYTKLRVYMNKDYSDILTTLDVKRKTKSAYKVKKGTPKNLFKKESPTKGLLEGQLPTTKVSGLE